MAGLLASVMAGASGGYANATQQNTQMGQNANLTQLKMEVDELMRQRIAENAKAAKQDEMKTQHGYRLEEIEATGRAQSKASKDPLDNETKKFALQQAKRKDAAMQEWANLSEQYDSAKDNATKEYLFPMLRSVESKLSSMGVNPRGTSATEVKEDPLSGEDVSKTITKTGVKTSAPAISGLPAGAKQIGTSGGKPVYQTPDGKKFIGD